MGVAESTPICSEVKAIQKWKWSRVTSSIKNYNDLDLPFGINASDIAGISGMQESDAKKIISLLSKQPDTGVVNALAVLSLIICLADQAEDIALEARIECLYDLIDFDGTSNVSCDEVIITVYR